ncbi:MAG: lytic transglycosylase domain-containing protein [Vampirovibrionales bacterium]
MMMMMTIQSAGYASVLERVRAIEERLGVASNVPTPTPLINNPSDATTKEPKNSPFSSLFSQRLEGISNGFKAEIDPKNNPTAGGQGVLGSKVEAFPQGLLGSKHAQFKASIEKYATQYGLEPSLVEAVIKAESAYNPNAKSRVGALGLMQLMPSTAEGLGVEDPLNPEQNIEGGSKYLASLMKRFNGDTSLAVAAYNAGPNAVAKYHGIPPYKETQAYVKKVLQYENQFQNAYQLED